MEKKRVVAYIRVSTEKETQIHSYEFQDHYWKTVFRDDPSIEFVGMYADKGISGHNIQKRPSFLLMMEDAKEHKFDKIYTKSVSRFARNTVQLLETVRELRELGIEVIFENENIHTFDPTSEIYLTVAATVAENDLEVDSERMKWSYRHRFEKGWISVGNGLYGFRLTEQRQLEIIPEEAAIVRFIYESYIGGQGTTTLAALLNEAGIKTKESRAWTPQHLLRLLKNEKYKGDAIMGKSVRHLGEYHRNRNGQYGKRYVWKNKHPGIVDEATWDLAQEIMKKRGQKANTQNPIYTFTGKIRCGCCGSGFRHKVNNGQFAWRSDFWACEKGLREGIKVCHNSRIKDSVLKEKFVEAYNRFVENRPLGESLIEATETMADLEQQEHELAVLEMKHLLSKKDYETERKAIRERMSEIQDDITRRRLNCVPESAHKPISEFDTHKFEQFVIEVTVEKFAVTFVFYNKAKITLTYNNGQAGNLSVWKKKKEENR